MGVNTNLPAIVVSIVCPGWGKKSALTVKRRLVGESEADFPDLELEAEGQTCIQIRDVIPAETMIGGAFKYEVNVFSKKRPILSGSREFIAMEPGT